MVNALCLNDWIIEVETLLVDQYGTIAARLPYDRRPSWKQWEQGTSPQAALDQMMDGLPKVR